MFEQFIVKCLASFKAIALQSSLEHAFVHRYIMMQSQYQHNLVVGKPLVEIMFDDISFTSTGKFFVTVLIFSRSTSIIFLRRGHGKSFLYVPRNQRLKQCTFNCDDATAFVFFVCSVQLFFVCSVQLFLFAVCSCFLFAVCSCFLFVVCSCFLFAVCSCFFGLPCVFWLLLAVRCIHLTMLVVNFILLIAFILFAAMSLLGHRTVHYLAAL